ncbi:MAG: 4-alpha-glucanotransferase [Bacilli bacterium]|nr:4-alpha-glucanotransferase [Bacilli bacterium]
MEQSRKAGILLPVASLPGRHGIGDFGPDAYEFVDMISNAGFSYWQILPLNPVGYGNSPYQPYSSFAIDENFISLTDLTKRGYLKRIANRDISAERVDYNGVKEFKLRLLRIAFETQMRKNPRCLRTFIRNNPWVEDYAAFAMFHRKYQSSWDEWPEEERNWIKGDKSLSRCLSHEQKFEIWIQMTAYRQWNALHKYALSKGIRIIGDVPFYVGYDSCDVWANQDTFLLSSVDAKPTFIAGVPPDYFSKTGQRWGNPIYDWEKLEREGFAFLKERIERNAKIYDVIRLDHFRAFDTYWKIPSSCETAIDGAWIEAPGYKFFDTMFQDNPNLKDAIIAEDLGDLRPEVLVLRDHYGFPGMSVVEFTFNEDVFKKAKEWNLKNLVVYLGTHDNDTMAGFLSEMEEEELKKWEEALEEKGYEEDSDVDNLIRFALDKPAYLTVLTVQDILGQGSEYRINVPGIVDNVNWTYKMKDFKSLRAKLPTIRRYIKKAKRA